MLCAPGAGRVVRDPLHLQVLSPLPLQVVDLQSWVAFRTQLVDDAGRVVVGETEELPAGFSITAVSLEHESAGTLRPDSMSFSVMAQTPDLLCMELSVSFRAGKGSLLPVGPPATACWVGTSAWTPSPSKDALLPRLLARAAEVPSDTAPKPGLPRRVVLLGGLGGYDGMKRMLVWQAEALTGCPGCGERFRVDYFEGLCRVRGGSAPWHRLINDTAEGGFAAFGPDPAAWQRLEAAGAPTEVVEAVRAGARFVSGCT